MYLHKVFIQLYTSISKKLNKLGLFKKENFVKNTEIILI